MESKGLFTAKSLFSSLHFPGQHRNNIVEGIKALLIVHFLMAWFSPAEPSCISKGKETPLIILLRLSVLTLQT